MRHWAYGFPFILFLGLSAVYYSQVRHRENWSRQGRVLGVTALPSEKHGSVSGPILVLDTAESDESLSRTTFPQDILRFDFRGAPAVGERTLFAIAANRPALEFIFGNRHGDLSLRSIEKATSLKSVAIMDNGRCTDVGLQQLGALGSLRDLWLETAGVSDASLIAISKCQRLEYLVCTGSFTDEGLAGIAGLQELRVLSLPRAAASATGLRALTGLKNLESLTLGQCQLDDESLALTLSSLKKLRRVRMTCYGVTDAGVANVVRGDWLEELVIWHAAIGPETVRALKAARRLKRFGGDGKSLGPYAGELAAERPDLNVVRE